MNTPRIEHDIERHIDLALRREADAGPPADFARSVAAQVREQVADPAVERWLVRVLMSLLVLAGIVVAAIHGRDWLPAFGALPMLEGGTAVSWMAAMLACVAVSWSLDRMRQASRRR
ncbi:MAG: hypothetical protein M3Y70_11345 [Pseudomonadota bacterium]|nr:hypothetical protein [Pseudomonadota bacterium]